MLVFFLFLNLTLENSNVERRPNISVFLYTLDIDFSLFVKAKRALNRGHGSDGKVLSPPLREDDRDGHYVFSIRENLTPRCEFMSNNFYEIEEIC